MQQSISLTVTVKNQLITEERDLHVYHNSSRTAHIISHGSDVSMPLRKAVQGDFLHISMVRGAGNYWENCHIILPQGLDFEFFSRGDLTLSTTMTRSTAGPGKLSAAGVRMMPDETNRLCLRIPPGPPTWELKLKWSSETEGNREVVQVVITDARDIPTSDTSNTGGEVIQQML